MEYIFGPFYLNIKEKRVLEQTHKIILRYKF